jgi:hypothetical protein
MRSPLLLCALFAIACGSDADTASSDTPWTTTVDSLGDTIRVRIEGEIPTALVRGLVAEVKVGAEDGAEEETFGSVEMIFGTASGGMLIYDGQAQAALMFDSAGAFVRRVGAKGGGPGEHGHLNGIARHAGGDWLFWDAQGGRINRYSPDGEFRTTVRLPITGWFLQDGLRISAQGSLYAWAMLERGKTASAIDKAGYIRMDSAGTVLDTLVLPNWGTEPPYLTAESADGGMSTTYGLPWGGGSDAAVTPTGGLVSGPGGGYVLYLLESGTKPVRLERSYTPVAVSATERSERKEQITQVMRRVNPAWSWTGPEIPSVKPAYRDFTVADDGRIWVRVYTPGEAIPPEELGPAPTGPNPSVRLTTREPSLYDVFSPDGRLLGRVAPPARTRLVRMRGNTVWGVQLDSLDVPYAVRFRVEPGLPE